MISSFFAAFPLRGKPAPGQDSGAGFTTAAGNSARRCSGGGSWSLEQREVLVGSPLVTAGGSVRVLRVRAPPGPSSTLAGPWTLRGPSAGAATGVGQRHCSSAIGINPWGCQDHPAKLSQEEHGKAGALGSSDLPGPTASCIVLSCDGADAIGPGEPLGRRTWKTPQELRVQLQVQKSPQLWEQRAPALKTRGKKEEEEASAAASHRLPQPCPGRGAPGPASLLSSPSAPSAAVWLPQSQINTKVSTPARCSRWEEGWS